MGSDGAGAAPRPWFVVPPPWNEGAPWIAAGSEDPHAGEFVCDLAWPHETPEDVARTEANAELICRAVNEHAVLRAALEEIAELPGRSVPTIIARRALDGKR